MTPDKYDLAPFIGEAIETLKSTAIFECETATYESPIRFRDWFIEDAKKLARSGNDPRTCMVIPTWWLGVPQTPIEVLFLVARSSGRYALESWAGRYLYDPNGLTVTFADELNFQPTMDLLAATAHGLWLRGRTFKRFPELNLINTPPQGQA